MCNEIKNANERANPGKYTDGIFSGIQERNQYGLMHCVFGLYHGIGQCADSFNLADYGVTAFQEAGGLHSHAGVPVAITVPALSVIPWLSSAMIWEMLVMN